MRVLIIEDDKNKLHQLIEFIKYKHPNTFFTEKYSYQSGLREIMEDQYDLLILDMSLPTFDKSPKESGGRPRTFAGRDILRRMQKKGLLVPVIVVTQFDIFGDVNIITLDQLNEELHILFPEVFFGLVYYNAALVNWNRELDELLAKVLGRGNYDQEELV